MKKIYLLLFIALCTVIGKVKGQSIYYDAVKLRTYISTTTIGTQFNIANEHAIDSILSQYVTHVPGQTIASAYKGNPYIKTYLPDSWPSANNAPTGSMIGSVLSSIGNLDVTNIADGIAKFLVARSKEELNVAFFSQFQTALGKYPELNIVFPTTYKFLNDINAYQYAAMLPALRSAFQKDLNAVTINLLNLRDITGASCTADTVNCKKRVKLESNFLNNTLSGRSIVAALVITNAIIKGDNVADAINNLANDKVCAVTDTSKFFNVASSIQFVNLMSQSLISNDAGRVWITKQQISGLISDNATLTIYMGLIYAKNQFSAQPIKFKTKNAAITLRNVLDTLHNYWSITQVPQQMAAFKIQLQDMANSFSEVADNAQNIINNKDQTNQASILIVFNNYASSISGMAKQAANFLANDSTLVPQLAGVKNDLIKFSTDIDDATNIIYDIKSQNYGSLVLNSSDLLAGFLGANYTFKDDYIKYGTFMASIVQANNSDEVNAAIDAAVLPVGSASIKRETKMNIALNAYIGGSFGWEYMPALKQQQWGKVAGVSAPIGVAFSWGDIKGNPANKNEGGKSVTAFVSLIDVGALASYRLQNDSSSVSSQVLLKNIVSPGLFLYYGFGKTPISLGLGAQYGPQLRSISSGGVGDVNQNYYFKFGASLVVDIPLFNLYTKSKN